LNQLLREHGSDDFVETHCAAFTWVAQCLGHAGLIKGQTIGLDATTLDANAALRSVVRRDTGEGYEDVLTRLADRRGDRLDMGARRVADTSPRTSTGLITWV
jgi:hypothetical protein